MRPLRRQSLMGETPKTALPLLCGSFLFLVLKHSLAHLHTELVLHQSNITRLALKLCVDIAGFKPLDLRGFMLELYQLGKKYERQ